MRRERRSAIVEWMARRARAFADAVLGPQPVRAAPERPPEPDDGGPPAHWIERVRRGAPELLRPRGTVPAPPRRAVAPAEPPPVAAPGPATAPRVATLPGGGNPPGEGNPPEVEPVAGATLPAREGAHPHGRPKRSPARETYDPPPWQRATPPQVADAAASPPRPPDPRPTRPGETWPTVTSFAAPERRQADAEQRTRTRPPEGDAPTAGEPPVPAGRAREPARTVLERHAAPTEAAACAASLGRRDPGLEPRDRAEALERAAAQTGSPPLDRRSPPVAPRGAASLPAVRGAEPAVRERTEPGRRWPELPPPEDAEPLDGEGVVRALDRRARLAREQGGAGWSG
jgi:hypothetical protein